MKFLESLNAADKIKILEFTYVATIVLLLSAVVCTPVFIRQHLLLFKKYLIQEDALEAVLIGLLLLVAYLLASVYKKELKKYRQKTFRLMRDKDDLSDKLIDAFKYIGGVNVQIHEIGSIFCGLKRYPATESEFKKDLALLARSMLAIVNADWVVIRIICLTNLRTLKEHLESRNSADFLIKGISNKAIVANQTIDGYSIVECRKDNSMIMAVAVFPKKSLNEEEKILTEAITHQIEMLYHIFVSRRFCENNKDRKPATHMQKKLTMYK